MSYLDCHNLALNNEFRARFAFAMLAYAQVVMDEDVATPNHTERLLQATKTINAPRMWADRFADAAAGALLGVDPSDAQLDALVAQWWNALALAPVVP